MAFALGRDQVHDRRVARILLHGPGPAGTLPISAPSSFQNPVGGNRNETFPASGGPPGSDLDLTGASSCSIRSTSPRAS